MLRSIALSTVIVAVLCLCGTAGAKIWHVRPGIFISSIQAGIDSSSHGDTVLVYTETYLENINFNGKNIVVGSLFLTTGDTSYISSTIIDGNSSGSVVTFENGEDSTALLTGFTVQNGRAEYGGGIYCVDSSSPSFADVTISGNAAGYAGAGLYCRNNSSPSLTNVTISEGVAMRGGGISCWNDSDPSLVNVAINGNIADVYGGGIYCFKSGPSLTNVTIDGNCAGHWGGAVSCDSSSPSLTNVTASRNRGYGASGILI